MSRRLCFGLAVLSISGSFVAFSQAPASVWDGIYTNDQAAKGASVYTVNCASCHGAKMEGRGQTPPLQGPDFLSNWTGMTVGDLFEKIQTSMPADKPGQVSRQDNAAILAYILKSNKFPAGERELGADSEALGRIHIDAAKPGK
jgi:S-disulfanyl-L-cysteine oxidoreductase SoxD